MQVYDKERELQRDVAERVAASEPGVEVLAVELAGPERFCVYIDRPGGVDHALCARVTELLRPYLERYTVDVSSPGPTRPLRTQAHFEAALARRVAVRTASEVAGRTKFRGQIADASAHAVRLALTDGLVDIPYDAIVRGNLIDEGR